MLLNTSKAVSNSTTFYQIIHCCLHRKYRNAGDSWPFTFPSRHMCGSEANQRCSEKINQNGVTSRDSDRALSCCASVQKIVDTASSVDDVFNVGSPFLSLCCTDHAESTATLQLTMGTPAKRLSLSRSSCSRHTNWTAGDTVSLKFPHDGCWLLSLFSRENDSPRCSGRRSGAETQTACQGEIARKAAAAGDVILPTMIYHDTGEMLRTRSPCKRTKCTHARTQLAIINTPGKTAVLWMTAV